MSDMYGPQTPYSDQLHGEKYRGEGETFKAAMTRVASALKDDDNHYREFREILLRQRFMPAGRIQSAMGSPRNVTPYNCFVSGTIGDSYVDGDDNIMQRAKEAAATMRMGGGIGYDFSTLRPRGSLIRKLQSQSSGPLAFMDIFDAVCRATCSSGHRRGAQMGVLRIDHPDIFEFINAKQNTDRLTGFNVSVGVTNEFMEALENGKLFTLRWGGQAYQEIDPADLWETLMRSTWDWAEPGVLFIDTINDYNNLWYCETIAATNPCGEQPLPPYGACLLGSFNLVKYVTSRGTFDWVMFGTDIPYVVRAMDNVVDRSSYPLSQQREEAVSKRRMGLGVTGLSNAAEYLGFPYGSELYLKFESEVLEFLANRSYQASATLADEKGSFPLFDCDKYIQSKFIANLNDDTKVMILRYGIRNSHLTSIAPTGTISLCADNVSSGIEPVFSYVIDRQVQTFDGPVTVRIEDYGAKFLDVRGKLADDVTAKEHIDVLATAQRWVDSAVSKTCNVNGKMPWEEFKELYRQAWLRKCKGCTTFNKDGKRFGVLTAAAEATCRIDPETGRRECN